MNRSWTMRVLALVALVSVSVLAAQAKAPEVKSPETKNFDPFENARFRNLGPAAGGGRVAAVAGVPGQPNVFYVGAGGGGVWKTTDGGMTFKPIFEKQPTASIGAIALAPSNPNLVWVGTGEANPRNDVITGKGVFFSPDGGLTWKHMGLENAGAISQIIVHPTNPDTVYVGVLGHVWGPNAERGVFRTTDGGKTWQHVLRVDDKTGVSDMVMDAANPMVLFAGMWEMQRYPWMLVSGGQNSGIYRSNDGGTTWKKLSEGLPKGNVGRVGLAVAPSNPNHVYALIQAAGGQLWESVDLGEHWRAVSNDKRLIYRGFYFTTLYVSPENENHLFFMSFNMLESVDGGKTANVIGRGVHPDHHALWIDPKDPSRLINGNDGGVYVSHDAGKSWRFLDNLPIEQFYMVATDDERPYLVCGGLQDNNGWCGPSNSLSRGGVTGADWFTATGGDGEYIVPAGNKSGIVYAESQNGSIQRLDVKTGVSESIRPYLHGASDMPTADLKFRFNWTTPIVVSPTDPKMVYFGGNVLFKSTDAGQNWSAISADLTRNLKDKQKPSGGPVDLDLSGAETFDTILSIALSAIDQKVIWVGTDDGLVQVTRDGGKTWTNVTPPKVPEFGRLQQIEVSPFDPATAYIALDYHEVDNNKPYVFKTHDYGKTWTSIINGLPANDPARVVRENPNRKGMLVLGTDTGLFYSYDDGDHWTAIKGNFPTVPVYDIKFVRDAHDLLVATHGRGLFALDNLSVAEQFTPEIGNKDLHVFAGLPATRWRTGSRHGSKPGEFVAPNPPSGAPITYYLAKEVEQPQRGRGGEQAEAEQTGGRGGRGVAGQQQGPVKIVISDGNGQVVRTLYGPGKQGLNRVMWNFRYTEATRFNSPVERERERERLAQLGEGEEIPAYMDFGGGPTALPGTYKVAVTFNGTTEMHTLQVEADPRFPFDMEVGKAQLQAALQVREWMSAFNQSLNRIENLKTQVATARRVLTPEQTDGAAPMNAAYRPVLEQARALERKLNVLQNKVYNADVAGDAAGRLHYLGTFSDRLQRVNRAVTSPYNQTPNTAVQEELDYCRKQLDSYLAEFNEVLKTDVPAFNKAALEKNAGTLFAGETIELKGGAAKSAAGR